jgi:penicillin amidase
MLRIQLDHEARFLEPWQRLMLETVGREAAAHPSPGLTETRRLLEEWGRAASTNSTGYLLARTFRSRVLQRLIQPADEACQRVTGANAPRTQHLEGPAWTLLREQPPHLLPNRFASYDQLLTDALEATLSQLDTPEKPLATQNWGHRNLVTLQHPFSRAIPKLSRFLDLPPEPLPGDDHLPRAQGPDFGASERFGVSPGHEQQGYLHMPGGQSGHFLSPFYTAGHRAWAEGKPLPFLPGPTAHRLTLHP